MTVVTTHEHYTDDRVEVYELHTDGTLIVRIINRANGRQIGRAAGFRPSESTIAYAQALLEEKPAPPDIEAGDMKPKRRIARRNR